MLKNLFSLIFGLLAVGFLACDTETYEKPVPQERIYYRFINLNDNHNGVDVRLKSTVDLNWLGIDLNFGESKPSQGHSSVLVNLNFVDGDSIKRDTSQYLFLDVLDHRSKKMLIENFDIGKEVGQVNTSNYQSWYFLDNNGTPIIARILDFFETPKGGKSAVRFINFNRNWLTKGVELKIKNDTTRFYEAEYFGSSGFSFPKTGVKTVYFEDFPTKTIIDSIPNVSFQAGRVYDFYLAEKDNQPVVGYYILK